MTESIFSLVIQCRGGTMYTVLRSGPDLVLRLDRGVYFYLFRDIHPGTVYEFLRIPEKFWMTHSMPKTFPEVMNIMLNVNCITKTFLEFQTLTESVYSIHS